MTGPTYTYTRDELGAILATFGVALCQNERLGELVRDYAALGGTSAAVDAMRRTTSSEAYLDGLQAEIIAARDSA